MLIRPKLKDQYHFEVLDEENFFLLWETGHRLLKGRLYGLVLPLVDGSRTTEEIVDLLEPKAPLAQIYYALMVLQQRGYLTEFDESMTPEMAAFWQSMGADTRHVRRKLDEQGIRVVSLMDKNPACLRNALADLGIGERDNNLTLYLVDDFLDPRLSQINREALESKRPWSLIKPVGIKTWIGPIFSPGNSACWQCLASRLEANRPIETFIQHHRGDQMAAQTLATLPVTLSASYQLATLELARWLIGIGDGDKPPRLENTLLTVDWLSMSVEEHRLVKRPQCTVCGEESYQQGLEAQPIVLKASHKIFTSNGGHRILTAEETYARLQHHISPITGVVPRLEVIKGANDGPIHNINAGPNLAMRNQSMDLLESRFRSQSLGKGKTLFQARASGLCEAIERYSGVWQGYEPQRVASFEEMGNAAIHPNDCMLYSDKQYAERERINQDTVSNFFKIPKPFEADVPLSWSPLWSLTHQNHRWLPSQFCYYAFPPEGGERYCFADSNGCASGNNLEEAVLQGLLEVVERDAVAVWWYNRLRYPRVDLDSFSDAYIDELQDYYLHKLNRDIWALDLTNDLGIPTYVCLSKNRTGREEFLMGFGTHLAPRVGLLRAITEMNQMAALLMQPGEANQDYATSNPAVVSWFKDATLENQPYLEPLKEVVCSRKDHQIPYHEDLGDDILFLVNRLNEKGLETLVLNQSRPDIGLATVKMVVPGSRHFWSRFAPGRLYDVPVHMEKTDKPLGEEELNPISMFL